MSFFLMFVIMAVATDTRAVGEAAAIAIGGTIGLDAMFGGPISGASMNPARSIGPAIVSGDLHALWLYILAPIIGASLAALTYQLIRSEPSTVGIDASSEVETREEEFVDGAAGKWGVGCEPDRDRRRQRRGDQRRAPRRASSTRRRGRGRARGRLPELLDLRHPLLRLR